MSGHIGRVTGLLVFPAAAFGGAAGKAGEAMETVDGFSGDAGPVTESGGGIAGSEGGQLWSG